MDLVWGNSGGCGGRGRGNESDILLLTWSVCNIVIMDVEYVPELCQSNR